MTLANFFTHVVPLSPMVDEALRPERRKVSAATTGTDDGVLY